MVDLLMSEKIIISSQLRNYSVEFIDDVFGTLDRELSDRSFIILDSNIFKLFQKQFDTINIKNLIVVEAKEAHKSYRYCEEIISELIEKKIKKKDKIVAIGGGIIQDITAFISSILFRGVEWIFIPTTLLAQADSCIGGKSSINFGSIKNLLGNFNPPKKIFLDLHFLDTLDEADIKSGIGEMLHFYFYSNSQLIEPLIEEYSKLLKNRGLLGKYIKESLQIKKSVIEVDEFDTGIRNLFNYGHTFGHALESVTNYSIKHGQAVTVGMDLANFISLNLDRISNETYKKRESILKVNFPNFDISNIDIDTYLKYLEKDKKNIDQNLVCILPDSLGQLEKVKIPMENHFREIISLYLKRA